MGETLITWCELHATYQASESDNKRVAAVDQGTNEGHQHQSGVIGRTEPANIPTFCPTPIRHRGIILPCKMVVTMLTLFSSIQLLLVTFGKTLLPIYLTKDILCRNTHKKEEEGKLEIPRVSLCPSFVPSCSLSPSPASITVDPRYCVLRPLE